ncbi:MAG: hypothetical protein HY692_00395 [Cyanobacteria bacterium NC_groundwater_1444_Ag_S-0.65um_54_12]|nr:hypothetical protein [Cyanobacteria bacterium NC_groundwater_1444_Ag_S-0.65um_54_12]
MKRFVIGAAAIIFMAQSAWADPALVPLDESNVSLRDLAAEPARLSIPWSYHAGWAPSLTVPEPALSLKTPSAYVIAQARIAWSEEVCDS